MVEYDLGQSEDTLEKIDEEEELQSQSQAQQLEVEEGDGQEYDPEDFESHYPQPAARPVDEQAVGHFLVHPAVANFLRQRRLQELFLSPDNPSLLK